MPFVVEINTRETETLAKPIQTVGLFTKIRVVLKYDSLASTFQLDYLFDPNNQDHTEVAGVSHYHEAIISYKYPNSGKVQKILTGLVLSQNFVDSPVPELLPIGGYSKPGLLEDCDIPTDIPLESNGKKLSDVISTICKTFNLTLKVDTSKANTTINNNSEIDRINTETGKVSSETSENAASYIKKLCLMKNIVLTHDADGNVVVKTANTEGNAVLTFDADTNPGVGYERMNLNYDGQSLFRITEVVRQADDEGGNSSYTSIKNPFCPVVEVPRYKVEVQTSGNDITCNEAAKNIVSKSLKAIVLTIIISTETDKTNLILPDNVIFVKNKKLNLFKMTKFFIEQVDIEQDPQRTTQTLTCVLPWVYNYNSAGLNPPKNSLPNGPYNVFIEPGQNFPKEKKAS